MPLIIVILLIVLGFLLAPLIDWEYERRMQKFFMEDMGWGKKKDKDKP